MNAIRGAALAGARLYLVCDALPDERLHAALRGGAEIVQLRCKGASDEQILAAAPEPLNDGFGVPSYHFDGTWYETMYQRLPPLLKRMVLAGWNGRKAGRGFYDYSDPAKPVPMSLGH